MIAGYEVYVLELGRFSLRLLPAYGQCFHQPVQILVPIEERFDEEALVFAMEPIVVYVAG